MLKKKLVTVALLLASCASSYGGEATISLKGGMKFQLGHHKDRGPLATKFTSKYHKDFAFNTNANILLNAEYNKDNQFIYGANIGLQTTTSSSRANVSNIYVVTDAGKLEFGSAKSAVAQMRVVAHTLDKGSGDWTDWARTDPKNLKIAYMTSFANFLDSKTRNPGIVEYSRKITYFTPKFNGFQIGFTYIPDTSNSGGKTLSNAELHTPIKVAGYKMDIKNGMAAAIKYEKECSSGYKFTTAITGESGKVVASWVDENKDRNLLPKFYPLKALVVGSTVSFNGFSVGAGYGNYFKSFVPKNYVGKKTTYLYDVSVAYDYKDWGVSLLYFDSKHLGNKASIVDLGVTYKISQGLSAYGDIAYYRVKGRGVNDHNELGDISKNKGNIFIAGLKLTF